MTGTLQSARAQTQAPGSDGMGLDGENEWTKPYMLVDPFPF